MAEILVANTSCVMSFNGKAVTVRRGATTAHADHPIVQAHPEMFSPLHVDFETKEAAKPPAKTTETASSAPGERRSVRPTVPRKPAPK